MCRLVTSFCIYFFLSEGAHPREPLIDLLSVTQAHTTSLEDHGRQLTKTLGQVSQAIMAASAKAAEGGGAAVRKMMQPTAAAGLASPVRDTAPTTSTTTTLGTEETSLDSELGKVERKLADLEGGGTSSKSQ